jgi:hypothetical protein
MAEKLDQKEIVTNDELAVSNMYVQEALLNLLEKKRYNDKKRNH